MDACEHVEDRPGLTYRALTPTVGERLGEGHAAVAFMRPRQRRGRPGRQRARRHRTPPGACPAHRVGELRRQRQRGGATPRPVGEGRTGQGALAESDPKRASPSRPSGAAALTRSPRASCGITGVPGRAPPAAAAPDHLGDRHPRHLRGPRGASGRRQPGRPDLPEDHAGGGQVAAGDPSPWCSPNPTRRAPPPNLGPPPPLRLTGANPPKRDTALSRVSRRESASRSNAQVRGSSTGMCDHDRQRTVKALAERGRHGATVPPERAVVSDPGDHRSLAYVVGRVGFRERAARRAVSGAA